MNIFLQEIKTADEAVEKMIGRGILTSAGDIDCCVIAADLEEILDSEDLQKKLLYPKDIEELKAKLWEVFPTIEESPCVAYKNPKIQAIVRYASINYRKYIISDRFELDEEIKEIYKQVA